MNDIFFTVTVSHNGRTAVTEIPGSSAIAIDGPRTVISASEAFDAGVDLESLRDANGDSLIAPDELVMIKATSRFARNSNTSEGFSIDVPTATSIRDLNAAERIAAFTVPAVEYEKVNFRLLAENDVNSGLLPVTTPIAPIQSLPDVSLAAPKIHISNGDGYAKLPPIVEKKKTTLSETIYRHMKAKYLFRVFKETLYYFVKGIYKKLEDADFDRLVSTDFRDRIAATGRTLDYQNVRDLMKKDFELRVEGEGLYSPLYWPFKNGILRVDTGEFFLNNGSYFITRCLNAEHYVDALCPVFDRFLTAVTSNDVKGIKLIWQTIGYLLSGDNRAKCFFVISGPKDTGKSVLTDLLVFLLGEENVSFVNALDLGGRFTNGMIWDKTVNFCPDQSAEPLNEAAVSTIKSFTGGDRNVFEIKFKNPENFIPRTRFVITTNFDVRTKTADEAFEERKVVINFRNRVPDDQKDFLLREKLRYEADGICVKAARVYAELVSDHYQFERSSRYSVPEGYMPDFKTIHQEFVDRKLDITLDTNDRISTEGVYQTYTDFCRSEYNIDPEDRNAFRGSMKTLLLSLGVNKKKALVNDENVNAYVGVKYKV